MKKIIALIVGLAFIAGNIQAADPPKVDIPQTLNVLGLYTPELDKLSDQKVTTFRAPVAKCLAHEFTSLESPAKMPHLVFKDSKFHVRGVPEHAIGKTELELFILTPKIRSDAASAGLEIKVAHAPPKSKALRQAVVLSELSAAVKKGTAIVQRE